MRFIILFYFEHSHNKMIKTYIYILICTYQASFLEIWGVWTTEYPQYFFKCSTSTSDVHSHLKITAFHSYNCSLSTHHIPCPVLSNEEFIFKEFRAHYKRKAFQPKLQGIINATREVYSRYCGVDTGNYKGFWKWVLHTLHLLLLMNLSMKSFTQQLNKNVLHPYE